ncbi:MAG TPA: IclR family transcriptional regulator [Mycobacteriales bacterium]
MGQLSGVGVLDKSVAVLDAAAHGPVGLGELVEATGLPRATAHRLAVALEAHRLLVRDPAGRWVPGPRLGELARSAPDPLLSAAGPVLARLRDRSGESAQLYRRDGDERVCVAAAERSTGLRTTVALGARLPMTAGSGAQVLCAWSEDELPPGARFGPRALAEVRRRGWAASVGQREAGVASVSAPVRDHAGEVVAAISVSGPVERLTRRPGPRFAPLLTAAATALTARL